MTRNTQIHKRPVRPSCVPFDLEGPEATEVSIVGSFNNWRPGVTPMTPLGGGMWGARLHLEPGRYEYRFLVDGNEMADPWAEDFVRNADGTVSSVLVVAPESAG